VYIFFAECPAGFTLITAVNGCYKLTDLRLNWNDSGQECQSLNSDAHLVIISSADEQTEIEGIINGNSRE